MYSIFKPQTYIYIYIKFAVMAWPDHSGLVKWHWRNSLWSIIEWFPSIKQPPPPVLRIHSPQLLVLSGQRFSSHDWCIAFRFGWTALGKLENLVGQGHSPNGCDFFAATHRDNQVARWWATPYNQCFIWRVAERPPCWKCCRGTCHTPKITNQAPTSWAIRFFT